MLNNLFHIETVAIHGDNDLYRHDISWHLDHGMNVVVGGTGLGKTTLLNATLFCLFGDLYRTVSQIGRYINAEYFRERLRPGDGAWSTKAVLISVTILIGTKKLTVNRSLSTGRLISWSQAAREGTKTSELEGVMRELFGVGDIKAHILRIVEHLLYVSEHQEYLISWDNRGQNDILNLLFGTHDGVRQNSSALGGGRAG